MLQAWMSVRILPASVNAVSPNVDVDCVSVACLRRRAVNTAASRNVSLRLIYFEDTGELLDLRRTSRTSGNVQTFWELPELRGYRTFSASVARYLFPEIAETSGCVVGLISSYVPPLPLEGPNLEFHITEMAAFYRSNTSPNKFALKNVSR